MAYARQAPSPFLMPYQQLLDAEKQVLRLNDDRRVREARMGDVEEAITNAEFRLNKRETAIAAIEARVMRIEETMAAISSGTLLDPNTPLTSQQ